MRAIKRDYFNPRSPHGERRREQGESSLRGRFQSTLPARGATQSERRSRKFTANFNPRSPHGERPCGIFVPAYTDADFNPRSPHGERPRLFAWMRGRCPISIHAPRTGSDSPISSDKIANLHFNPRSPHGERHWALLVEHYVRISIHAPRTGSDKIFAGNECQPLISIHAPRTGSDDKAAYRGCE